MDKDEGVHMRILGIRGVGLGELSKRALKGFFEDDMVSYAAALAYYVFLALFPFSILLLALLGFLGIPGLFDWLLDQAEAALPGQAMGLVEQVIGQIRSQSQGWLLLFGIAVGLWSAPSTVWLLMVALNVAYDVEETRPLWKRLLLSVVYTLGLAVLITVATALMMIGPQAVMWLANEIGIGTLFVDLWSWLRWPVTALLLMLVVAIVYYVAPDVDEPFRFVSPGAVLCVIGWLAASLGFSYYVSNFATYGAVYGSLSAVIVLLLEFFISASVLLLGAEVNAVIYHRTSEAKER
jgi:membrane protein